MWFKKSYDNDAMGTFESMEMIDAFKRFYDVEHNKYPDDAKGLTMFDGGFHYFHYTTHYQYDFFIGHGCSTCGKPSHKIKFLRGDEEFSKHHIESFSKK